jgi:hypothetical protein
MPHLNTISRRPAAALLTLLAAGALASVGLAACGSSSSTTGSTTANAAVAGGAATGTTAPGARGSHFAAMRACLQKQGITLPPRRPGAGGFFGGGQGGPRLPSGVTRAQYEAALKKCGGGSFRGGFRGGGFRSNPRFRQAYAKFAACMHQNGIDLPAPNTSGTGPIFDTKGIDTTSPQFTAAIKQCRGDLFAAPQGGGAAGGGGPAGGGSSGQ